ncbi:MAG: YjfB family protein [Huintestinicola sp.]
METSIASMAMGMHQTNLMASINTSVMKKAMETTENQAQCIIEMAQALPKFNGEIGSVLDVRA